MGRSVAGALVGGGGGHLHGVPLPLRKRVSRGFAYANSARRRVGANLNEASEPTGGVAHASCLLGLFNAYPHRG